MQMADESAPRATPAVPKVQGFYDEHSKTVSYVIYGEPGGACAVIDPVLDFDPHAGHTNPATVDRLVEFIRGEDLTVEWILETHIHHDHLSGAHAMKQQLGGRIVIGAHAPRVAEVIRRVYNLPGDTGADAFDRLLGDGETFGIGGIEASVFYTPGHTIDSVSYRIGNAVFVGDVMFMPDFGTGRCNFHGGDAHALYRSIRRLLALPPETRMFTCHDYRPGGRAAAWETTVAAQRAENVHAHDGVDEEAFVRLRTERDQGLDAPALLLPSLQVNIRGGRMPEHEANGTVYLKIPVDIPGDAV